jgi:hypothetical protein
MFAEIKDLKKAVQDKTVLSKMDPAAKRALLLRLMSQGKDRPVYPLSFAQSRIWFLEQLTPGLPHHHIVHAVRLPARLDPELLQQCWNVVIGRHQALRTRIENDGPSQVVDPFVDVKNYSNSLSI